MFNNELYTFSGNISFLNFTFYIFYMHGFQIFYFYYFMHLQDLKDIESLDARWMDLSSSKSQVIEKQRFWSYEWEKHGTCSEKLYNQDQYFDLAVRLYEHFNITAILQNNKITRGNAHSLSSISAPIKAATGFQPDIRCIKSRKHQQQSILLEIGICWDFLGASPINCRQGYSCGNVRAGHDPRVLFP
ncbi:hypothetical protein M9H77_09777 [Catharanthus roseus]|uniref:Uncharacterized protein n=1 Tax=Catharanthus roseus TaxID=4058 RepID=A0ACC0C1R3_CATRO|nr:hypothetical protein M9H77_09777 [Catharanthus roseus]